MKISPVGLELICTFESLRLKAYTDSAGIWTIGYGTIKIGGVPVKEGMTCTKEQAVQWMDADLARFEREVNGMLKREIDQHEYDALVSFAYNVGTEGLRGSTLIKKVNLNEPILERYFTDWNKVRDPKTKKLVPVAGLTRRRKSEFHLYCVNQLKFDFK